MTVFEAARTHMIESQLRPNKVTDERVLGAFAGIRRELFVPEHLRAVAYIDDDLPLGGGRYLMEPMVAARLLQAAAIERTDTALIVGAGRDTKPRSPPRWRAASSRSKKIRSSPGVRGTALVEHPSPRSASSRGRLPQGYRPRAPYDVILFGGAVAEVPSEIDAQLAEGGRLMAVVKSANGIGRATLMTRTGGVLARRVLFDAATPLLPGFVAEARLCVLSWCSDATAEADAQIQPAWRISRSGLVRSERLASAPFCGGGAGSCCARRLLAVSAAPRAGANADPGACRRLQQQSAALAQRALLRATDEQVPQALAYWRPTVNFTGQAGWQRAALVCNRALGSRPTTSSASMRPSDQTQLNLQVTQPIYRGGRTEAQTRQAINTVKSTRAQTLAVETTVFQAVAQAYLDVVRDQALVEVNRNNVEVLRKQLEATQDRFRVGEVTRTDVAQAESSLAQATGTADHRSRATSRSAGPNTSAPSAIRPAG